MAEWPVARLDQLAAPTRNAIVGGPFGSDLVSSDYVPEGVPVVRGENLTDRRWVGGDYVFVTAEKAVKLAANTAGPLDIVFTQRGANHYRQVAVVPSGSPRLLISQSQMKVTVDTIKVDPLFIYYVFRSAATQEHLRRHAIQTGVPHTNLGILKAVPIPLPPLAEQKYIVGILGALDDKIELNRTLADSLGRAVGSAYRSLVTESAASAELRRTTIDALAEVVGGSTPSTSNPAFWGGEHQWATPKDLAGLSTTVLLSTERTVTGAGLREIPSGLLPAGTVLMSSRAPIGYLAIAETPVAINQGFIAMKPRPGISNLFLMVWAATSQPEILSRANGSTFLEISKSAFRPIELDVPTPKRMAAFDVLARPLYQRIVIAERQSRTLREIRDSLLPGLLDGSHHAPDLAPV